MESEKTRNTIEYRKARKQAREIRGFYIHLMIYCVTIPILIAINLIFVPGFYWFPLSMIGWGLGLSFHWMEIKKYTPFLGKGWEERKIRQFMDEERNRYDNLKENKNGQ